MPLHNVTFYKGIAYGITGMCQWISSKICENFYASDAENNVLGHGTFEIINTNSHIPPSWMLSHITLENLTDIYYGVLDASRSTIDPENLVPCIANYTKNFWGGREQLTMLTQFTGMTQPACEILQQHLNAWFAHTLRGSYSPPTGTIIGASVASVLIILGIAWCMFRPSRNVGQQVQAMVPLSEFSVIDIHIPEFPDPDIVALLEQAKKININLDDAEYDTEETNRFFCPIRKEVMTDPVIAADGTTYQQEAIWRHMMMSPLSPITGLPFKTMDVISDEEMRKAIKTWLKKEIAEHQPLEPEHNNEIYIEMSLSPNGSGHSSGMWQGAPGSSDLKQRFVPERRGPQ